MFWILGLFLSLLLGFFWGDYTLENNLSFGYNLIVAALVGVGLGSAGFVLDNYLGTRL